MLDNQYHDFSLRVGIEHDTRFNPHLLCSGNAGHWDIPVSGNQEMTAWSVVLWIIHQV